MARAGTVVPKDGSQSGAPVAEVLAPTPAAATGGCLVTMPNFLLIHRPLPQILEVAVCPHGRWPQLVLKSSNAS